MEKETKIFSTPGKVESVDFHPTKPWILASYSTKTEANYSPVAVSIWDYESGRPEQCLEVSESPVRTAKFIERQGQGWIVCGSNDGFIRVYDYNTWKKVKEFKEHGDFISCLAVHAKSPRVLSALDDKTIKLWDWEKDWTRTTVFQGHSKNVMYTAFGPEDSNTFASASLDSTVEVWNIDSPDAKRTFKVPDSKGINCVNWFGGVCNKEYLIIGCNDCTAKVLDYETSKIVKLEGHTKKVTAACKHPDLPYLITGSEDETVRLWDTTTHKLVKTLNTKNYRDFGGVWGIACKKGYKGAAFGCDKGVIVVPNLMP